MKKIYTLLLAAFAFQAVNAQTYGWMKPISSGAGTNVYSGFCLDADNNPVVIGGAEDYGGGAPNGLVFMKFNKTDGQRTLLKKYNGNTNSEAYKIHTDANGNFYYFGTFTDYIVFGTDTLYTNDKVYWNRSNYLLAKFDPDGNHLWSRNFGRRSSGEEMAAVMDAYFMNGEFSAMIAMGSDSVFYNKSFVTKLPIAPSFNNNYCLMKVDLADGSLKLFKSVARYDYTKPKLFAALANGEFEFGVYENYPFTGLVVFKIPADGSQLIPKDTIRISPTSFSTSDMDVIEKVTLHNNNYYLLTSNNQSTGASIYGTDTIRVLPSPYNLKGGSLIRLNASLEFVKAVRFHWREDLPVIRISNNKIIIPARFSNTMYIEQDSVVCNNNQQAWEVMVFDENLSLTDTFQVNTANSSGGSFSFRDAHMDAGGNVYAQFVHNKNMLFNGTVVQAALKSWDHLTVLTKRNGTGGSSGLKNSAAALKAGVYPNPSSSAISLDVALSNVVITNMAGQVVLETTRYEQIDISSFTSGVYFITGTKNNEVYRAKFVRN